MKKLIIQVTILALLVISFDFQGNNDQAQAESDRTFLPDAIPYPNGITRTSDGSIFVGSVTTGAVVKIEPINSETELFVAPQTTIISSTSLRADEQREVLWACSSDVFPTRRADGTSPRLPSSLVALNLDDGTAIKSFPLPQDGFCNDLAIDERGGVLVTDSFNPHVLYLPPNQSKFEVWAQDERFGVPHGFGLAGIAIAPDQTVYVGIFTNGQLYRIRKRQQESIVEPLHLTRTIANPDGMAIASDGSLIVCEGNYQSGNGRLLQISLSGGERLTGDVQILAEGLDAPVNLSLGDKTVWITEGRLRSLLLREINLPQPESFWIRQIPLP